MTNFPVQNQITLVNQEITTYAQALQEDIVSNPLLTFVTAYISI